MAQPNKDYTYNRTPLLSYGTTTNAICTDVASKSVAAEFYTGSIATSGASYGLRCSHKVMGTGGSGAAVRGYAYAVGVTAAAVYGGEFTAEIHSTASSAISGTACGVRAVMSVQGDGSGTLYAGEFDFSVLTGKSAGPYSAFLNFQNLDAGTGTTNLFNIVSVVGTAPDDDLVSTHADHASTHLIKCMVNNTTLWLLACNAHT